MWVQPWGSSVSYHLHTLGAWFFPPKHCWLLFVHCVVDLSLHCPIFFFLPSFFLTIATSRFLFFCFCFSKEGAAHSTLCGDRTGNRDAVSTTL